MWPGAQERPLAGRVRRESEGLNTIARWGCEGQGEGPQKSQRSEGQERAVFWSPGPGSAGTGAQERGRGETNIRTGAFGDWAG